MRGIKKYLVDIVSKKVNTKENFVLAGETKIYIPDVYENEFGNVDGFREDLKVIPQRGKVVVLSKENKYGLEVGCEIVFHRSLYSNKVGDVEGDYNELIYIDEVDENKPNYQIYFKVVNDEIETIGDWVVVSRIEKKDTALYLPDDMKHKQDVAIVKYANPKIGVKVGDTLGVVNNNFITIEVDGEKYSLVNMRMSVPYFINSDKRVVLNADWVMVKAVIDNSGYVEQGGLLVPSKRHKDRNVGVIESLPNKYKGDLKIGDSILFERMEFYCLEIKGEAYYFVNEQRLDQVIGVLSS